VGSTKPHSRDTGEWKKHKMEGVRGGEKGERKTRGRKVGNRGELTILQNYLLITLPPI